LNKGVPRPVHFALDSIYIVAAAAGSVSNTCNTETGFPLFETLNTDTVNILAVLPVLERIKWGTFDQNYYLLKQNIGQYAPNLLCFYNCKLAFILAYLSKTRLFRHFFKTFLAQEGTQLYIVYILLHF
jgi:hypothetical protein